MQIGIRALGAYVPEIVVDNSTIAKWADTTPAWIQERTGIVERRYTPPHIEVADLARMAVEDMLKSSPACLRDVGAVIVSTSTSERSLPATADLLHGRFGLAPAPAWTINAACSGWLLGLVQGYALAPHLTAPNILLVAADRYSTLMHRPDKRTVALFGDGGAATTLAPVPDGFGLLAWELVTHGEHSDFVGITDMGKFAMQGPQIRKYFFATLPDLIMRVLATAGVAPEQVGRWLFHQANPRMLADLLTELGIDPSRAPGTAARYGNTGSASIPITLHDANRRAPFSRGELVLLASVGAGMNAAAALLRWH